jgi:hypothetical protein
VRALDEMGVAGLGDGQRVAEELRDLRQIGAAGE